MPLAPSTRLGPYEILAPLGAGGIGLEVYQRLSLESVEQAYQEAFRLVGI